MKEIDTCREITKNSNSSFYFAMRFLGKKKFNAICSIYAFCRTIDDLIDNSQNLVQAKQTLDGFKIAITLGHSNEPILAALLLTFEQYKIPKKLLLDLIAGMEEDLNHHGYSNFRNLKRYCYRVAGTVGIMIAHILGFTNKRTLKYAEHLGTALQLINIIRDIGKDAQAARVYVPEDLMHKYYIYKPNFINYVTHNSLRVKPIAEELAQIALKYFNKAKKVLPSQDRRKQFNGLIMGETYINILKILKKRNYPLHTSQIHLSLPAKIKVLCKTFFRCFVF